MKTQTEERIDAGLPDPRDTADSLNRQATALQKEIDNPMTWSKCFAVPGSDTIIDIIHPVSEHSFHYGKSLEDARREYPGAEIMTVKEHCLAKAARQDAPVEWAEETEEQHWNMLECVPPACMMSGCFLVGEPWNHHALSGQPRYQAHIKRGGKYLVASRPMTVKEFKTLFVNVSAQTSAEVAA